jgi:hypothetical protein
MCRKTIAAERRFRKAIKGVSALSGSSWRGVSDVSRKNTSISGSYSDAETIFTPLKASFHPWLAL